MPNKLFVAGLPETVTEEVLRQLFESTGGTVVDVRIPKDRTNGKSRRFGFVTLTNALEADAARLALDGSLQGGKVVSVRAFCALDRTSERKPALPSAPLAGYQMIVSAADAARVEELLRAAQLEGIVTEWSETRVFAWSGVPNAAMGALRRTVGERLVGENE